ncbi:hypothetical protein [Rhodococcus sp. UNC23MFCrub1.1]|uniref:hypothetical protein n=1 Tax=Rhodococcus sp. UNC23MFCrub1.1 TaxID=1449068 RepID=UPI000691083C|nr:hypothetical protein [Rhodococcus sp. UNC23MFCrub1.1]
MNVRHRRPATWFATAAVGVALVTALAAPASAAPAPGDFSGVPERTSLSYTSLSTGVHVGTANENEARPGLSTVKLYLADHVLRQGDSSAEDRDLAARMIQVSDDWAASLLDSKYPGAIDAAAREYGLTATSRGSFWGDSYTSTADTVRFLDTKKRTDPGSPVLTWMTTALPVAADGTVQDWGTGRLAAATGTKWGWADDGSSVVASASIGDDFTVAANTYGGPATQSDDVLTALGAFGLATPTIVTAPSVPSLLDAILGIR